MRGFCGLKRASAPPLRSLPIIAPTSEDAARWGLAAALQGRYPQFHRALFAAGRPDAAAIEAAARVAGLDMEKARKAISDPKIDQEIARNLDLGRKLGLNGTPSWVVGQQMLFGAVGQKELGRAIAEVRSQKS